MGSRRLGIAPSNIFWDRAVSGSSRPIYFGITSSRDPLVQFILGSRRLRIVPSVLFWDHVVLGRSRPFYFGIVPSRDRSVHLPPCFGITPSILILGSPRLGIGPSICHRILGSPCPLVFLSWDRPVHLFLSLGTIRDPPAWFRMTCNATV